MLLCIYFYNKKYIAYLCSTSICAAFSKWIIPYHLLTHASLSRVLNYKCSLIYSSLTHRRSFTDNTIK